MWNTIFAEREDVLVFDDSMIKVFAVRDGEDGLVDDHHLPIVLDRHRDNVTNLSVLLWFHLSVLSALLWLV